MVEVLLLLGSDGDSSTAMTSASDLSCASLPLSTFTGTPLPAAAGPPASSLGTFASVDSLPRCWLEPSPHCTTFALALFLPSRLAAPPAHSTSSLSEFALDVLPLCFVLS